MEMEDDQEHHESQQLVSGSNQGLSGRYQSTHAQQQQNDNDTVDDTADNDTNNSTENANANVNVNHNENDNGNANTNTHGNGNNTHTDTKQGMDIESQLQLHSRRKSLSSKGAEVVKAVHDNIVQTADQKFIYAAMICQIFLIVMFGIGTTYETATSTKVDNARYNYALFQHVNVMMFIGFGYLMTFLRMYGYSALSLNFMLAALCIQWGMFMEGLVDVLFTYKTHKLNVSVDGLAEGDIAAAVILISMGALLGRTTPLQLLVMAMLEIVLYAVNLYIVTELLHVNDVGGSITVHCFGCYFGLALSYVLGPPRNEVHNDSEYHSDLFSMIGTLFLWMYWPSFNGIFAGDLPFAETRCFLNTVLSLASCVIATMGFSMYVGRKFNMVHMQNSTLAGGVAMGSAANLFLTPAGAMTVGFVAAFVSVFGFQYVSDYLQTRFRVFDTCGINNLHGMPGILGALVSVVALAVATKGIYAEDAFAHPLAVQALFQILGLLVTLAMALAGGVFVGGILRYVGFAETWYPYSDKEFFLLPHKFRIDNPDEEYEERTDNEMGTGFDTDI